jgi:dTDP-4-dehydrorhamnose reductase
MSSEAVFAGTAGGCDEDTAPVPTSLYGQQKVKVEARLPLARACIVRTGSVVGDGTMDVVSQTYRRLLEPGAKMAHDNMLTVTAVEDVAAGLIRVAQDRICGVVHMAASPPVARTQLADWIMRSSRRGLKMAYQRAALADLPTVKSGRAWLLSKRAAELGLTFSEPMANIERRVAILDGETQ